VGRKLTVIWLCWSWQGFLARSFGWSIFTRLGGLINWQDGLVEGRF
jgi:hypothetical protein